jgi:lipid-binding SYLF domain-containing protein
LPEILLIIFWKKIMRIRFNILIVLTALMFALPATAATKQESRVADSTDVIDQFLRIPEQSIPPTLLARAYAIAVIPAVVKVGFGIGARRGKGVLVVRQDDNSWSNPAFVTLTGGSIGWQIGAQSTDIILVFKSRKGVEGIENGKVTLGANAAIAAGPVGRQTEVATDATFKAEVFSYSRNRGLFAGVAVEGAGLTMDRKSNAAYYGSSSITPEQIFAGSANSAPASANNFVQVLTAQTRRLPTQPGMGIGMSTAGNNPEPKSKVRTYGIGDPDAPGSEYNEVAQEY